MLDDLEKCGNIRIINSMQLLERFLSTLKDEIKNAAEHNQPVLVLVFGHGDSDDHGVAIGGDFQRNAPRLVMGEFEKCLRKDVDVTLMITSCYSGGWVTKPRVRPFQPSLPFNISGMTAASAEQLSWAWATSQSIGKRAGGSIFATAVMNALMATSQKTPGFAHMCEAFDSVVKETDDGESIRCEPTYISLAKSVYEAMRDLDPGFTFEQRHGITFAAKDDNWDIAWRRRTGFPLVNYQSRWEMLRSAPSGPEISLFEGAKQLTGGDPKLNILRERAFVYMNTFPGADNSGNNIVLHALLRSLLQGDDNFDDMTLDYMDSALDYRDFLVNLATDFAQMADLNLGDARKFDVEGWLQKKVAERKQTDLNVSATAREQLDKYLKIRNLIVSKKLFGIPLAQTQGPAYERPKEYLAIAFAMTNLSFEEVEDRVNKLHQRKSPSRNSFFDCNSADEQLVVDNAKQYLISEMPVGTRIMADRRVSRARDTLRKTLGRVGQRLRSLSPSKN